MIGSAVVPELVSVKVRYRNYIKKRLIVYLNCHVQAKNSLHYVLDFMKQFNTQI